MTEVGGDTQRLRHAPGTPEITVRWGGQSKLARRDESTTLVRVRELAHCNGRPSHWQDQHQRLLSACDSASRISCLFPNNGSHGAARVITPRKTDAVSPWLNHTERRNLKKKRKKSVLRIVTWNGSSDPRTSHGQVSGRSERLWLPTCTLNQRKQRMLQPFFSVRSIRLFGLTTKRCVPVSSR